MSAVFLLISKNPKSTKIDHESSEFLRDQILSIYGKHFNSIEFFEKARCLLAFFNIAKDNFFHDKTGNWLVYEGTVFDAKNTIVHNAASLWKLYENVGASFLNKLDGHFVIKLYDTRKNQFLVGNDIIKSRSTYLAENDQYFMFTPFLPATAFLSDPQPDMHSFNEMLWRYYILSHRTLFKGIKRLSPASCYIVTGNKKSHETYWEFPKSHTDLSFQQTVDNLTSSMLETARLINKVLPDPVSDLTLGQDSRLIVASFLKQKLPILTSTFGKDNFSEIRGVKELVKRHNIPHHTITLNTHFEDSFVDYFRKSLLLSSGDEPGYILGRILFMREQQMQWGSGTINGAGGPFYKDCFWEEFYTFNFYQESKKLNESLFLKLRPMNKNYNDSMFSKEFLSVKEKSADYFLRMFNESQLGVSDLPLSMQIDKFALTYWQNYAVRSNDMANTQFASFSPLLFKRNLEIGLPAPAKWRWNKSSMQRAVMHAINPQLAKEATDFGGINMVPKNALTFIPFYTRYALRQTARMRTKLLNKIGIHKKTHLQEAWDYLPLYKNLFKSDFIQHHSQIKNMSVASLLDEKSWNSWLSGFETERHSLNNYEQFLKIIGSEYIFNVAQNFKPKK